jgi:hypothetical protein
MLLHVVLQCENFVNWAMKALDNGSKVVEPPATTNGCDQTIATSQGEESWV